jgi:hypothetical protein
VHPYLRRGGITARIVRIGVDSSERPGRHRWGAERPIFWLPAFRRLAVRDNRSATAITSNATLVITIICARCPPQKDF